MSLADDCERLAMVLAEGPKEGLTMTEINERTGWTLVLINAILCALGKQVGFEKGRQNRKKVTRYFLKDKS